MICVLVNLYAIISSYSLAIAIELKATNQSRVVISNSTYKLP
jgi:hypothetical protein